MNIPIIKENLTEMSRKIAYADCIIVSKTGKSLRDTGRREVFEPCRAFLVLSEKIAVRFRSSYILGMARAQAIPEQAKSWRLIGTAITITLFRVSLILTTVQDDQPHCGGAEAKMASLNGSGVLNQVSSTHIASGHVKY